MTINVEFFAPPGQSLTLLVCEYGTYTPANGAGDAATETARAGLYTATIAEALTGWHTAHIVAAAGWELPIGDVLMAAGEICRVRDHDPGMAEDVWAYARRTLTAAGQAVLTGTTLVFRRGDSVTVEIPQKLSREEREVVQRLSEVQTRSPRRSFGVER
jgi:hypothetical protein